MQARSVHPARPTRMHNRSFAQGHGGCGSGELGTIDLLIDNVGGSANGGPFEITEDVYDKDRQQFEERPPRLQVYSPDDDPE